MDTLSHGFDSLLPLKSLFLPTEALQGEPVPSYFIWQDIDYEKIRVEHPKSFTLKGLYNVEKDPSSKGESFFEVGRVKTEGYLGIVFSSSKLSQPIVKETLRFSFLDGKRKPVLQEERSLTLFRPLVRLNASPLEIKVDPRRSVPDKTISLEKLGKGTVIMMVKSTPQSQVSVSEPEVVRQFRQRYSEDLEENLATVIHDFQDQSDLTNRILKMVRVPVDFTSGSDMKELFEVNDELDKVRDEKYQRRLGEAILSALLRNIYLITVAQLFVDYYNSIGSENVLIPNPFHAFKVTPEKRKVQLRITYTDFAFNTYPEITLPEITLVSKEPTEIPVFKLLSWAA